MTTDKFNGMRPLHCKKPQEELELSDFIKVIRPTVNGRVCYARIPIRRKTPERILCDSPIKDDEDLERRIKAMVKWYRECMPEYNISLSFEAVALTDEEMDALVEETAGDEHTYLYEVERK